MSKMQSYTKSLIAPLTAVQTAGKAKSGRTSDIAGSAPSTRVGAGMLIGLALLLVATAYADSFLEMGRIWSIDPNYSHGFLVPFISGFFAWQVWRRHGSPFQEVVAGRDQAYGVAEIAFGLLLHPLAWFIANWVLDVVALICILRGSLLLLGGQAANRAYGFAGLFLIFMAPLPISWYQPIAIALQQIVSGISATMLDLAGAVVYREGYLIHLPGYTMEVGQACSGLRQLWAIVALAAAVGYLSGRSWRYRWTLGLLAVPLAVLGNCLRVVLTGAIAVWFGPQWAEGVFHALEGMATSAAGAVMLLAVAWLLARWPRQQSADGVSTCVG